MSSRFRDLFREVRDLKKRGEARAALELLREPLRDSNIAPEDVQRAGRLLSELIGDGAAQQESPLRILLLGQVTTSWLVPVLTAVAWGRGVALEVIEGGYDNLLQDLHRHTAQGSTFDSIVLIPWGDRLMEGDDPTSLSLDDHISFWEQCWSLTTEKAGSKLIQVGFDTPESGAEGLHLGGSAGGRLWLMRRLNDALREHLPPGSYFLDLERAVSGMGRKQFYDRRRYFWTKQPFSEAGSVEFCRHLWSGIRAVTTGPKKVLVLDLDNTLWGGVVGELGPLDIGLGEDPEGEAFRAFQRFVKGLARRGVVLAVASKNNPEDALAPFEQNPSMVLSREDFSAFEANWGPKDESIRKIATELNLGLDSFVFFDDNPFEQELVRRALPEVEVVPVPEDASEFVAALESGLWFETVSVTEEDRRRAGSYQAEDRRKSARESIGSLEDYLASLEMKAKVQPIRPENMHRVLQLIGKTNQFNLTTRRHSQAEVETILSTPGCVSMAMHMEDRFGDYGLIGVLIAPLENISGEKVLRIDTWLMSCRVIGRTAEDFMFTQLAESATRVGARKIIGEYYPTKKNVLVSDLYPRLGFRKAGVCEGGGSEFAYDLESGTRPDTFVRKADAVS